MSYPAAQLQALGVKVSGTRQSDRLGKEGVYEYTLSFVRTRDLTEEERDEAGEQIGYLMQAVIDEVEEG